MRSPGSELVGLVLRDRGVLLVVLAVGRADDDAGFQAVQEPIVVGALQRDRDPPGDPEREHRAEEDREPQEPGHVVQREPEVGGDQVVATADPEQAVEGDERGADTGPGRHVARPVQQVVLALVAGDPALDERIERDQRDEGGRYQQAGMIRFQLSVMPQKWTRSRA